MIYLCCPYSHRLSGVRHQRFCIANMVASKLMSAGFHVFSPISHTHPIAEAGDLPKGWEFWEQYDRAFLGICSEVVVIAIKGWRESVGVQAELVIAAERNLPVRYVDELGEETSP